MQEKRTHEIISTNQWILLVPAAAVEAILFPSECNVTETAKV